MGFLKKIFKVFALCGLILSLTFICPSAYAAPGDIVPLSFSQIAAGQDHVIALKTDGSMWAWGSNFKGQLGDGTTIAKTASFMVNSYIWKSIASGRFHSVAVKDDGTLWGWGDNQYGQIGDGSIVERRIPVQIGNDSNWVSVKAGAYHSVAIKTDGSLWAWGYNAYGQLGDGTTVDKMSPVQIFAAGPGWRAVACGYGHNIVIKTDGTLWAWGDNAYGQLGNNSTTGTMTPVQIGTDTTWTTISSFLFHNLALKSDGTLWAWGYNEYKQLGDGTVTNRNYPFKIGNENTWTSVSAGALHSLAVKTDGTLWTWGFNYYGQLGNGTTFDSYVPSQIAGDSWTSITGTGEFYSVAQKADHSLWSWGYNYLGEVGDGTTIERHSPVIIDLATAIKINDGAAYTNSLTTDLTFSVFDKNSIAEMQFSNDNITWTAPEAYATSKNWILSPNDGLKTVYCKFKSNLGTWSPAYSASISLDTTAPTVNIISPTAATQSTTPLLSYAVSEGTVTVKVDGVTVNNVSGDTLYLAAGLHTVLVESCDGAGNKGSSEIQFTVLQPPTVILNSPAAGYTNNNLPLLTYTVSNGTVVVKVDDVVINKVSGDTLGPLVDGTHWVQVVATNAGGSRMAQQLFTVDTVAPTVSITSPTSGTINTSYRLLSYTVSDGTVVVKLDGVTVNKTSGSNLGPFADGPHTVRVEATDAAGNKGFAEVSFTVDVLPTVSISSPASGLNTNNNSPILTYTVSNGTVVVKVDGIVVNKVSGDSLGPLADGTHLVRVEATDTAGTGFSEKSFIVDTVAPDISISSPTTGTTTDNQPLLTFTSNAGGTATVKVDGVVVNKFNGSRLSTLANGPHTVRVEMRDMASNVGVAEVTFTVNALLTIPSEDFETGNLGKLPWVTSGNGLWTAKTTTKHGGIYSAEAPVSIVDSQSASLEVPVNCVAGNLIFWYSVSSEANFDFLTLYVDGVQKGKWSGSVPWTQATVAVTAGTHTFKWVYSKDGSVSTGSDTAWVDDIVFPTVTSGPPPTGNAKNEGFESGNLTYLPWVTSGNGLWAVKTTTKHGGIYAVEAPVSITDNQNAGIEVTQNCAAGNITFWYSVSSEANYDYLRFYIDGIEQSKWSGSIGWNQASFPVIAGSHTFKLTYSKDGSVSSGSDTAWIDDIVIPVP